jgi:hypothetical protein
VSRESDLGYWGNGVLGGWSEELKGGRGEGKKVRIQMIAGIPQMIVILDIVICDFLFN